MGDVVNLKDYKPKAIDTSISESERKLRQQIECNAHKARRLKEDRKDNNNSLSEKVRFQEAMKRTRS
jgi:hypothetical protein